MKYYQVIFVDEYDNFYELGYYASLADAEPYINSYLDVYHLSEDDDVEPGGIPKFGEDENLGRLVEYPNTFGPDFTRIIWVEEGAIQIRGFIKDTSETIECLMQLIGENNE